MNKARVKSMKKFWLVLSLAIFCLVVGSLWEYSLNDWSVDKKLFLFQERLKFEEKRLDDQLRKLDHEESGKSRNGKVNSLCWLVLRRESWFTGVTRESVRPTCTRYCQREMTS